MDLSKFTLSEIVNVNKEYLENEFFKLKVENKDYIILISYIGVSRMDVALCFKNDDIDGKNPIEHKILIYKDYDGEEFDFLDFENILRYPSLNYVLEDYNIELSKINDKSIDYAHSLFKHEMVPVISESFRFKALETPTSPFESELAKFLKEISAEKISDDEKLQEKLIKSYEHRQKVEKEINEHMKDFREIEKKKQEFNNQLKYKPLKKSDDYNIRW